MKKITLFLIPALFSATLLLAQAPEGPADKGMTFGIKTTEEGAINADDLAVTLKDKESTAVKVKGEVVEVCKAEGCWLKMKTATGNIMIRMNNHAFFVPLAMNGKTIVVNGTAAIKETSVDMLKHYAEDAGKSKEEIEAITAPKKEVLVKADGILVI
ncbi:MAG: DUF4920 domain-containing protein [Chitinophagaceae bacterium]|nr:DUF4920 domain-containing protein [Chitinophagaceae bacterium]